MDFLSWHKSEETTEVWWFAPEGIAYGANRPCYLSCSDMSPFSHLHMLPIHAVHSSSCHSTLFLCILSVSSLEAHGSAGWKPQRGQCVSQPTPGVINGLRTPPRCKWKSCPQIGSGFWLDFRGALRLQNTCGVDCSESPCTSEHLLDVTGSCFWSRSCFFSEARTEHPW